MSAAQSEGLNIGYYLALVSRRRWFIIVPFCLAMIVGMALTVTLPKMYEASTLILVQAQRVPEKIVSPVVDGYVEGRISTLSQQIMSRSNLERVIGKFKLFSDPGFAEMLAEDKIASLRKRIKVEIGDSKARKVTADSFSILFQDSDPQTAMKVTNGLATFFIDENLKARESMAVGTTDFLDAELDSMRKRLEDQEEILKKFREQHMGELPEQLSSNLSVLEGLNQQLSRKEESLRSARLSLASLEKDISLSREGGAQSAGQAQTVGRVSEENMSVEQLQERLALMKDSYTDQHPDVLRLKARIERRAKEPPADSTAESGGSAERSLSVKLNRDMERQKNALLASIRVIEDDMARLNRSIRDYQRRIEIIPKREQELLTLRRDYDNIRASYNSLSNRKLEADIAVNMEKKQKGEQFYVIDVAQVPERPISPKLPQLFGTTVAVGLALGAGLVFMLEMMDKTVRRLDKLEEEVGLPVLAMMPRIFTSADRKQHRMTMAATTVSIVVALALTAAFAMLVFIGVEPTLDLVRYYARA
jgi:polysaccharide chain length determinant protein (PEP-CTERM system associated)